MKVVDISVVVPVHNECESLPDLYEELTDVLTNVGLSYEIVFVDDGSTDGSVEIVKDMVATDAAIVLVELRRRFGKAMPLQAGFRVSQGEIVITMDADLQDDPKEIPRFIEALGDDKDLISGWKLDRKDPWMKTIPSRVFNFVTSKVSGVKLHDFNCGFKAYRREVIEDLNVYGDLYRYIPVVVYAKGFRVDEIPVSHRARKYGKSKYGPKRFTRGALDLFTILFLITFQKRPLHLFGLLGTLLASLGFLINAYLSILWFNGEVIGNRPLLTLGTLMIVVGIQTLFFGLLGEMIVAVTYRPSEVAQLVHRVHRHDQPAR